MEGNPKYQTWRRSYRSGGGRRQLIVGFRYIFKDIETEASITEGIPATCWGLTTVQAG